MTRPATFLTPALLLALALAVGCSNVPKPDEDLLAPDGEPAPAAPDGHPAVPWRIGVLPLVVDADFEKYVEQTKDDGSPHIAVLPDDNLREEMVRQVVDALDRARSCEAVRYLPGGEQRGMDAALQAAWDDGLDIVARPVLRRRDCSYAGATDAYVPALIMWFLIFPPSTWWLADEKFSSETVVTLELYSTAASASAGPVAVCQASGTVEYQLDDFDQGFNFFNVFITPSGLSDGQWNDIGKKLLPLSQQAAQRDWIEQTRDPGRAGGVANVLQQEQSRLRKTLTVFCGAAPAGQRRPRFAAEDARSLRNALASAFGTAVVTPRGSRLLDGVRAARADLTDAIDGLLVQHARAGDRALLVLALRGIVDADGRSWLLLADSKPGDLANTAMSVDDLADSLGGLEADTVVIAAVSWDQADPDATIDPWKPLVDAGVLVFSGIDPAFGERLLEIDQLGGSLFVDELGNALRHGDEADANNDGRLTFRELAEAVRGPVDELSSQDGVKQTPRLMGPERLQTLPFFHLDGGALPADPAPPDEVSGR